MSLDNYTPKTDTVTQETDPATQEECSCFELPDGRAYVCPACREILHQQEMEF